MKKAPSLQKIALLFCFFAFLFTGNMLSQSYNMGNGTINGCSGTFYDPGGGGNYGNGANFTQTICSNNGQNIYLQFSQFQLESGFDNLVIYNGPNTASPVIGSYTGTSSPGTIQGTGTCITLVFTSDASVTYLGWVATIGCGTVPPPPPAPPGDACNTGIPFCTGTAYNFPAGVNQPAAPVGPAYGCLGSQPNPVWYFLQMQNSGPIDITLSNTSNVDVDFILWGPFTTAYGACLSGLTAGTIVDCSYSTAATEYVNIPNGITGQYYILLMTNFSNSATNFTFSQTGGTGTTNCNILCNITAMTAVPGACSSPANTFNITGNISTYAPPNSGTLTITSSCGGSVVYGPPFTTSTNYTVTGVPATGGTCTVTAQYSADPLCNFTTTITAPPPCNACAATAANTGPYCAGSTISLSATGGGTYSWSGPGGFTSTAQNPTRPSSTTAMGGVYTVTVTVGGVTCTATTTVTVNPIPTPTAANTGPYCAGSTISLSSTGGGTYSWSGPNGFTSTAQNPTIGSATAAMGGVYTVTVTASGCTATATTTVTVNPLPTPTAANTGPYCAGATISLSATPAGATYSWSGPGGFTSTAQNPTRPASTVAMNGVYTVTVTVNGCTATATTTVTVNPIPTPTAANTGPYCAGATISLTATGGGTYSWSGPNAFTSTSATPTIGGATAAMGGVYTVTVTASGCTATATTTVTVNPIPTPTANNTGPFCAGTTISLFGTGGGTYSWSGPNAFTSTAQNPTIAGATAAMGGVYTLTVTASGCTATATTTVTVNPLPTPTAANTGPYCAGATISLSATGGGTYSWSGPGGFTSAVQNPTRPAATVAMGGVYTVTVTVSGCTATATTTVTVNPLPTPTAANTGPYCPGATISLSSTGGGTYSWSGPNAFTSATQNPTIAGATAAMGGVYTVTVTASGCTATATTTVTVNPAPTPTANNTGPYCLGSAVNLSSTGGGTYAWSGPNGFTSAVQNPSVGAATAAMAGVYTVTVTVSGCTATATTTVAINAALVPGLGSNSPICQGQTLNLTCSNGVSWAWTGPNAFSSSAQNPGITGATPAASGTYSATVTDASGCTGTGTVAVVVNPLPTPTAANTGPYCPGATISLSSTGGGTYSWSGPNAFTSATQNPTIAGATTAMSGVYTVTVTSAASCTATATTTVTVNPSPTPTANNGGPFCLGTPVTLTSTGGGTYAWSGPNGFTAATQNPSPGSATAAMGGVYTVTVTVSGCTATATTTVAINAALVPGLGSNSPVCAGQTLNLTCSNGVSWTWTGPNAFSSSVQNPSIAAATTAASGTYSATVTDASGCTGTGTIAVVVNPLPNVAVNSTAICLGQGTATLTATGATTYSWSAGTTPSTGATVNATPGGTTSYTVTGTDANGCVNTAVATVTVNPLPVINVSNTGPYCVNGTIQLNATGGTTYAWTGPNGFTAATASPTTTATTLTAGQYDVTVTDANGCTATGNTTVVVNTALVPGIASNSPICDGAALNLTCSNGVSWSWTGPNAFSSSAQNPTINPATPAATGTYSISVTDANGCVGTGTILVFVNPLPLVTVNSTAICSTQATATLTANGGISYSWNTGATTVSITDSPLATTSYTVTGTDANGCQNTAVATITVNPLPVITVSNTGPYCVAATIQLDATGGTTYAWTGPNAFTDPNATATIANAQATDAGTYSVTVTDANGCTASGTTTVVVNTALVPVLGSNSPICEQQQLNLTCGNGVSWTWTGPNAFSSALQNPSIVNATPAATGTYSISLTDANGCVGTGTIAVVVNPLPVVTVSSATICATQATATLTAAGAVSYSWNTGAATVSITDSPLNTTTYTVTGTDANGCQDTSVATITVNQLPNVTVNSTAICPTFTANLTANGAVTYAWTAGTTPATGANVTASPAATTDYTVTGTDANGCTNTAVATVTVNAQLTVNAGVDDTICIGANINLAATGGPAGTTYQWSPGGLPAGANQTVVAATSTTFTVLGTDPNGCQGTDSITITVPADITLAAGGFPTTCNGVCDGQVVVLANPTTGGFAQYTYAWTGGGTTASVNGMCAGNYTVTVTNNAGCVATATTVVTQPTSVTANATGIAPASCNGTCDGTATINPNGGTAPYNFAWSSIGVGATPINLCAGNYTCTVSDANGCSVPVTVTITQPTAITAGIAPVSTICIGQAATLTATPGGGNGGYTFTWTAGTTPNNTATVSASPTVTTGYTVSISDANGCTPAVASVTVTVNPPLSVIASADVTICNGQAANMSANAGGGNGSYFYSWATGTTPGTGAAVSASPTVTTTYTVTLTDGCGTPPVIDSVVVTVNPLPTLSITTDIANGCAPVCATFSVVSNPAAAVSNWITTDGQTQNNQNSNQFCFPVAGTYGATVSVTDVNGCQNTFTNNSLVVVYPVPSAEFEFNPQPASVANPVITFTDMSTGANITSWYWQFNNAGDSTSALQNPVFDFVDAGSYDVWLTVTSDFGCVDSINHTVVIDPEFLFYVPNAFSPNDDGINDVFFPKGLGIDLEEYQMWIYDRWGNMIWTTDDFFTTWNGKVQGHDEVVMQDVYVWKIKLKTWKGEKKSYVGHVTVVK